MNLLNKSKITGNLSFLAINTFNHQPLLDLLKENKILSVFEVDTIMSKTTPYEKSSALYDIIIRKEDRTFDVLIECLNKSGNETIANKLVPQTQITPVAGAISSVQPNYPNSTRGNDVPDSPDTRAVPMLRSTGTTNEIRQNAFASLFKNRYGDKLEFLGEGGWGVVYKCAPNNLERDVAVKLIKNKNARQNVEREIAESLKIHSFENIVEIFYYWFEKPPVGYKYQDTSPITASVKEVLFIEMEYCDLGDLWSWFEKRWWDKQHAKTMLYQITKGLVYLHSINVLHRDLKPQNIMLCSVSNGLYAVAKICDFGVAKQKATKNTTGVGTSGYIAPEVLVRGGQYGYKSDVYALAITFFDMLVMCHEEYTRLETEIIEATHKEHGFEFTENIQRILSVEERNIIEKMIHKDINIRLSAKELLDEILPKTYEGIAAMKIPNPNRN